MCNFPALNNDDENENVVEKRHKPLQTDRLICLAAHIRHLHFALLPLYEETQSIDSGLVQLLLGRRGRQRDARTGNSCLTSSNSSMLSLVGVVGSTSISLTLDRKHAIHRKFRCVMLLGNLITGWWFTLSHPQMRVNFYTLRQDNAINELWRGFGLIIAGV